MELRHLRYFIAVAEALSYRRASERLHVAQPALSKQIKDLEDEVGARLLNRNTARVTLTDAGAVLLDEARDILDRLEMAIAATREADAGRGGRLTIGNLGAISASILPAALTTYRAHFPHVEVNLHEVAMPDQVAALKAGNIQLGFTIDQGGAIPADLESSEVLTSKMMVALGRNHPLAQQSVVSLADIVGESLLCIGETQQHELHRKLMDSIFVNRGIKHRPIKRVNGFESLIALVAGGHGVSLLLPFSLSRVKNEIVFCPIQEDGEDLVVRLLAIWSKKAGSQLARNFADIIRNLPIIQRGEESIDG